MFIVFSLFYSCCPPSRECENYKRVSFRATITDKVINYKSHSEENLLVKDLDNDTAFTILGVHMVPTFTLFRMVERGDTIWKTEASDTIFINKINKNRDTFIFSCNYCNK
jgi:hypothetical protein